MKNTLVRLIAFALLGCMGLEPTIRAETTGTRGFNPQTFEQDTSAREKELLVTGKLHTIGSLFRQLKADPLKETIALPEPSTVKLDPTDLYDHLAGSTMILGLYYHCHDCGGMHMMTGGGFAVAKGGIFSTCVHMLALDPKKMLQAYPVAISSEGKVYPIDRIIAFDPVADTALVHVEGYDPAPLPMRGNARVGESAYCLSHPGANPFIFTSGLVSRVDIHSEDQRSLHTLEVSCEYSPGSSGCPITDGAGNVLAQADKISPQVMEIGTDKAKMPDITVYNLRSATGALEIARLADAANRPPFTGQPPAAADEKPAASAPAAAASATPSAKTAAGPTGSKETFAVHSQYALVVAPPALHLDEEVKNFKELFAKIIDPKTGVTGWARDETPSEATNVNYDPVGFGGNTGYYAIPGTTGPLTMDNTIARNIDFGVTYRNRTASEVEAHIKVNDNRATPAAEDNIFEVDTKLSKGAFTLIKLGPPLENKQAWLALLVDHFDAVPMLPMQPSGTLPADKKVDFVFTAADGQQIDTTKMRGKVILVDFWATWCGPCVAAMPRIEELYDKYHKDGLEVIGINLDSERSVMDSFLKRHPHPWPQSVSAPAGENPLADRFEIKGIPFFLLIDKAGLASEIEARNPTTEDLIEADLKP